MLRLSSCPIRSVGARLRGGAAGALWMAVSALAATGATGNPTAAGAAQDAAHGVAQGVAPSVAAPAGRHAPPAPVVAGQAASADATTLAALAARAKEAMAANRFDEAASLYREILAKMPDEPGILMNLGMALSMSGRPQEAIDPLARALTLRGTLLPAALFLGQSYLQTGRPADAIAPLQKYVAAQPSNLQARQMLASAQLMADRPRDAAAEFRRVSQAAPADPKGWYGLVQAYDALSQEALLALQKTPDGADYAPLLAADAFESEGKPELAFAAYKASLEKLPRLRSTQDALARLYTKTGHPDWAKQQTAKAQAIPLACADARGAAAARAGVPTATATAKMTAKTKEQSAAASPASSDSAAAGGSPSAGAAAGRAAASGAECEFRARRYLAAITVLGTRADAEANYWRTRAYAELASEALGRLTKMPASQELHELRAELYRNQRRHVQSAQELKAALAFAPNDPRLRRELAKSLYFTRDWEGARALLEALLKSAPKDPELEYFYGEVLLQSQQAEAALPHLQTALDADPTMAPVHAALGRALVQLGRFAEAIPHLEPALSQDTDGSIHYQLARAYQGTGQSDRAKPLLERYQALQRATQPPLPDGAAVITPP